MLIAAGCGPPTKPVRDAAPGGVRRPVTLNILVEDAEGRPVAGAKIRDIGSSFDLDLSAKETTPGRYRFEHIVLPAGLEVTAAGHAPAIAAVAATDGEPREFVVRLQSPAQIRGVVVDERGAPRRDVNVSWTFDDEGCAGAFSGATRTGADGSFVARDLRPGRHRLYVNSGDAGDVAFLVAPTTDAVVRSPRPGSMSFRLRTAPGEAPPTDGFVNWSASSANSLTTSLAASAGAGWVATDLSPGKRMVSIDVKGFDTINVEAEVRPGEATDLGELALVRGATWRGRVVDAEGRPIYDARVRRVRRAVWPLIDPPVRRTSSDGKFAFGGVEETPEMYEVTAEGHAERRVLVGTRELPTTVMLDAAPK